MSIQLINEKVSEVKAKLEKVGMVPIDINLTVEKLRYGVAGNACFSKKSIKISEDYLKQFPDDTINDTIPHEMCHIYQKQYFPNAKQNHGPQWKRLMIFLGLSPSTYHTLKLAGVERPTKTKKRFIYLSEKTQTEIKVTSQKHYKIQLNPSNYSYRGEKIKFTNKLDH